MIRMSRLVSLVCLVFLLSVSFAHGAYTIEHLSNLGNNRDFVVGPGKVEVEIKPGGASTSFIYVTNRTGRKTTFDITVEDFKGSRDQETTVVLLGDDHGPYSLRDFIKFSSPEVTLENGDRATIPVTISIPSDAEPGGRYGTVVLAARPETGGGSGGDVSGTNAVIARIGTLFFVKIPGKVKEDGVLKDFSIAGGASVLQAGPVVFRLLFENNGSIYLNPRGQIDIENTFGSPVGTIKVDPWYALPDSLRLREVSWDRETLFGRYTAHASINRGYGEGDIVDEKTLVFWVLPWKLVLGGFLIIILVVFCIRWLFTNITIGRRT